MGMEERLDLLEKKIAELEIRLQEQLEKNMHVIIQRLTEGLKNGAVHIS
jgi:hypothetical protein